ncbi:glycosyltransferase [Campylobacter coli]|uniref:glycosyltransferase n=1 Tax=Campylobacter coli TaxID=195 RepID=UPI001642B83E|nr:glycosyltransferase [Campylobacter coli]
MKKTTIIMACDHNLVFAVANMIIGIKRYCYNDVLKIVIMYDNIQKEEIDKVCSIWSEKIEFKLYSKNDFLKDVGCIGKINLTNRFGFHLVYAKFYIFNFLKDYESVLWLDVDMLLLDNIISLLSFDTEGTITKGNPKILNKYLQHINKLENIHAVKPNGGFIHFNKSVLQCSASDLTQECFLLLKDLYDKEFLKDIAWGDEIPFGVLIYKYKLKVSAINKVNTLPNNSKDSILIHAGTDMKFWSSFISYISFQEWHVNNKIWNNSNEMININFKHYHLPIKDQSDLYQFLFSYNLIYLIYPSINILINYKLREYRLYMDFIILSSRKSFNIYSSLSQQKNFYYQIEFEYGYGEWGTKIYFNLILKDFYKEKLKSILLEIADFKPSIMEKLEEIIIRIQIDINQSFLYILEKIIITTFKYSSFKIECNQLDIFGYSAKSRIQNQLSYKLGQAMIANSKSLLGYIRMPFVLSYIKDKHKQEQKIYQEKIKKDPSLKLPSLESYPDYKEALKEKECLTYKLGEALIKANKTWYKGGYVKLIFEIRKLKKEFGRVY